MTILKIRSFHAEETMATLKPINQQSPQKRTITLQNSIKLRIKNFRERRIKILHKIFQQGNQNLTKNTKKIIILKKMHQKFCPTKAETKW